MKRGGDLTGLPDIPEESRVNPKSHSGGNPTSDVTFQSIHFHLVVGTPTIDAKFQLFKCHTIYNVVYLGSFYIVSNYLPYIYFKQTRLDFARSLLTRTMKSITGLA